MSRINVGVLRGGPSDEYDVSLVSGATVIESLPEETYNVKDILISREGEWFSRGMPTAPNRALQGIDVVFIALHGEYGEDGAVQRILDTYNVPYTGSGAFASAIAMNKGRTKKHVGAIPCTKMPPHAIIHYEDVKDSLQEAAQKVFAQFGPEYIIKPLRGGSSMGIFLVDSVSSLPDALDEAFQVTDAVIVEQFIQGKEATCGVVENMRDEKLYMLPAVEILYPSKKLVLDYESKYSNEPGIQMEKVCPGNFTSEEKDILQKAARHVHQSLGLRHYSRSDFIISPSGIYFLEVNTLPGLTESSLLPKSLDAVGISFSEFLEHLLSLALAKKRYA